MNLCYPRFTEPFRHSSLGDPQSVRPPGRRAGDFRLHRAERSRKDDHHGTRGRPAHFSALQRRIGVQLQQAQLQKRITVWEAVDLWASLYPKPVDGHRLLEQLGLADKRNAWFMTLSGGQKQRLFIALALINDPELVFLDELTTGLDRSRGGPSGTWSCWRF